MSTHRTALGFSLPLAILVTVAGCAAPRINAHDPVQVGRNILVEHDDFKKITTYTGPNCAADQPTDALFIRAFKTSSETVAFQVYVSDIYTHEHLRGGPGWRFYSAAHDRDGNTLPMDLISRHVNWCGRYVCEYLEVVGVRVTRSYLEDRANQGLSMKISGTGGEEIVSIPAAYIQAFLKRVPDIRPPITISP